MVLKKTKKLILLMGVFILTGLWVLYPVSAMEITGTEETEVQKLRLLVVDEEDLTTISGAVFTLAEKTGDAYVDIADKTAFGVTEVGLELELPVGMYRLTQLTAADAHILTSKAAELAVGAEGVTLINDADNVQISREGDVYTVTVSNMAGFILRLPSTGGTGTLPYTLTGLLCMLTAVVGVIVLRKRNSVWISVLAVLGIVTVSGTVSVRAAEISAAQNSYAEAPVYTYYVMMKASDGSKGEAYYVEDETLANALLNLKIQGEPFCTVTKVLGTDYWIVVPNEAAAFTEKEAAAAFAGIKDLAITSGITNKNEIELEYNGFIYIESDRGEQFLLEGDIPETAETRVKQKSPTVTIGIPKVSEDESSESETLIYSDNAEIGGEVTCKVVVTIPASMIKDIDEHEVSFTEFTIRDTLSEGLTPGTISKITIGAANASDTEKKELTSKELSGLAWEEVPESETTGTANEQNKEYTLNLLAHADKLIGKINGGYKDEAVEITYTVVVNDKAKADKAETNAAVLHYCYDLVPKRVTPSLNTLKIRTFGFELDRVNRNGVAVTGEAFTLQNAENGKYYTLLDSEEAAGVTPRFQEARCEIPVDEQGSICFLGLKEGQYILTQTRAADGYRLPETPITLKLDAHGAVSVISGTDEETDNTERYTDEVIDPNGNKEMCSCYYGKLTLKYDEGIEIPEIPSSGGSGAAVFYMAGMLLMLAAGAMLAVRRR